MRYPDEPIDPELQAALDAIRTVPPRDPQNRLRGRARFLSEARELEQTDSRTFWQRLLGIMAPSSPQKRSPGMRWGFSSLMLVVILGLVLVFSGSVATAYAAQNALPGDPLFGLKNATEDAQIRLNLDPGADANLHLLFAQRRIEEIQDLIEQDRFEDISIATGDFERHILQAIAALGQLAASDPTRAAEVTDRILTSLNTYTSALTDYLANVPTGSPQQALEIAVQASQVRFRPSEIEFSGIVSAIEVHAWVIAGKTVKVTLQTRILGAFNIGDRAEVEALVAADGALTAKEIKLAEGEHIEADKLVFTGIVEQITPDRWMVSGQAVIITTTTEIKGTVAVGDNVQVEGTLEGDGSLTAMEIKLIQPSEDPTGDTPDTNYELEDNGESEANDHDGEGRDENGAAGEEDENGNEGGEEDGEGDDNGNSAGGGVEEDNEAQDQEDGDDESHDNDNEEDEEVEKVEEEDD